LIEINRSFTRLTRQQIEAINSPRLKIIDGNNYSSFNSLAQQSAISFDASSILRLLNRAFPSGKITELDKLKTVTFDE
jgi:predicted Zn-dependent protease